MPAANSPRSTPAIPRSRLRPPPPARAQPGRHDRRRPEGRQSLSRPRSIRRHTALDRHASPNPPPARHARPSAPCCLDEVTHTHDAPRNLSLRAPTSARWSFCRFSPASSRRFRRRKRHMSSSARALAGTRATAPLAENARRRRLAGHTARARRRVSLSPELHALPDWVSVATGVRDGRGHHDRWLEAAVAGNVRIVELPEYGCAPVVGEL